MHFSQHKLYCVKKGSHGLDEICTGSLWVCKHELFEYLCKDADCFGEINTWRALEKYCEKNDIPLSFSPKHDMATFDTWSYFID